MRIDLGPKLASICHPESLAYARGLCRNCYMRDYRNADESRMLRPYNRNRLPLVDRSPLPVKLAGVRANTVTEFPIDACPKCGNQKIRYVGREARCWMGCGYSVWLVREMVST